MIPRTNATIAPTNAVPADFSSGLGMSANTVRNKPEPTPVAAIAATSGEKTIAAASRMATIANNLGSSFIDPEEFP
jgi:hypothetical protein